MSAAPEPALLRFGAFTLDRERRQLLEHGRALDINARYFDALCLLAAHPGELIAKDRFLTEVWRGVPVTDEALTQCIRTLRRVLGDDASAPRFIQTVPKYGYRFVASDTPGSPVAARIHGDLSSATTLRIALGSAAAGVVVGAGYGLAGIGGADGGALSGVLVLAALTALAGLVAGFGIGSGIALADRLGSAAWKTIAGGALGGLFTGLVARLVALDSFAMLFGREPGAIAGAAEGLVFGAATGLAVWRARRAVTSPEHALAAAAAIGLVAGALAPLLGLRLMGGSLASLAASFPGSRLDLAQIGQWFGEDGFGQVAQALSGAGEAAVFVLGAVAALTAYRKVPGDL